MSRKAGFHLKHGFIVIAIPDSGLFVKNGRIVSGHGTEMKFDELVLFSRSQDAKSFAKTQNVQWEDGDVRGHQWNFEVLPILVSERL